MNWHADENGNCHAGCPAAQVNDGDCPWATVINLPGPPDWSRCSYGKSCPVHILHGILGKDDVLSRVAALEDAVARGQREWCQRCDKADKAKATPASCDDGVLTSGGVRYRVELLRAQYEDQEQEGLDRYEREVLAHDAALRTRLAAAELLLANAEDNYAKSSAERDDYRARFVVAVNRAKVAERYNVELLHAGASAERERDRQANNEDTPSLSTEELTGTEFPSDYDLIGTQSGRKQARELYNALRERVIAEREDHLKTHEWCGQLRDLLREVATVVTLPPFYREKIEKIAGKIPREPFANEVRTAVADIVECLEAWKRRLDEVLKDSTGISWHAFAATLRQDIHTVLLRNAEATKAVGGSNGT